MTTAMGMPEFIQSLAQGDTPEQEPRRRRGFTRAYKRQAVEDWLRSGMTRAAAARKHDIYEGQAWDWKRKYLAGEYGPVMPEACVPPAQVPVAEVKIQTAKGTATIPAGADAALIRRIVEALQ